MFHYLDDQPNQGCHNDTGSVLVERIMAAEYNLAVQRQGAAAATPAGILAQILGLWLQDRASR